MYHRVEKPFFFHACYEAELLYKIFICILVVFKVHLPAKYVPKGSNKIAQCEYYHYHADYSEQVAQHYPPHYFVMISELFSIFFSHGILIFDHPLDLLVIKRLDKPNEFLW